MKVSYLTFLDAQNKKDNEQPDCMICDHRLIYENENEMPMPWKTVSIDDFSKINFEIQSKAEVLEWIHKQPRLVEVSEGAREPRDAHLKPFPKLQPISEQK